MAYQMSREGEGEGGDGVGGTPQGLSNTCTEIYIS